MQPPSNSTRPPRAARLLGWALLALSMYAATSAVVLLVSLVLLQQRITPDWPWIATVQERLYFDGVRNIWQARADCVAFDPELIYKPREGACRFANAEFDTVLHFTNEGRNTGPKPQGAGIAVLGDSHAMGWGVEDDATFSAQLQRLSGRPVYNLAVSSYGTARELIRLEKSGLLDKVDTVIIQYCDNDLEENLQFRPTSLEATRQKFAVITQADGTASSGLTKFLARSYWRALRAPFSSLGKRLLDKPPKDFSRHYQSLIATLARHDMLQGKRVVIFYSNARGGKFRDFPAGRDPRLPHVEFIDLGLERQDYYRIDDHLTNAGHGKIASALLKALYTQPVPRQQAIRRIAPQPVESNTP